MTPRQQAILEKMVERYIHTNEPTSSLQLAGELGFSFPGERAEPLSSAMLRIEMASLEDEGWLEQPHASSGRTPTMQAMRWFARGLVDLQSPRRVSSQPLESAGVLIEHAAKSAKAATAFIAQHQRTVVWSGLQYLAYAPEVRGEHVLEECLSILESLAKHAEDLFDAVPERSVLIYVGDENPVVSQPHFSMLMGRIRPKISESGMLTLLGPVRMDYAKAIATLKGFMEAYSA